MKNLSNDLVRWLRLRVPNTPEEDLFRLMKQVKAMDEQVAEIKKQRIVGEEEE